MRTGSRRGVIGRLGVAALALAMLAACAPTMEQSGPGVPTPPQPAMGERIGNGSVKVALLLPRSAPGNAGIVAASLRNAAEMAVRETPGADITLIVEDDKGTREGARAAAVAALDAGAELILGPLLAPAVRGVAEVTRPAGVPVLALSSDATVAARGVYVLGFLPEGDAERIASFAEARGRRSLAALLPENGYGGVFGAALQKTVSAGGGSGLVTVARYPADGGAIAARVAGLVQLAGSGGIDAVAAPAADEAPLRLGAALASARLSGRVQLLGSGQWDDARILSAPGLEGGWFPAPDKSGFTGFAARYAAAYGSAPPRPAALAFDATRLAAGLTSRFGTRRFAFETLTNANGFSGVDGAFRLLPNGLSQRSLAIYEIRGGRAEIIDPAPKRFPPPPQ